jgi:hypothetical protein
MTESGYTASQKREPVPGRPRVPDGYGQVDPQSPAAERLPWATVEEWLVNARTYWLTTAGPTGRPHAVPVWGVWRDGCLAFSTGAETATARNLAANPVALAHPGDGDRVAIIEGTVEGFTDRSALAAFATEYRRKYDWTIDIDAPPGPIFRLVASRVLSWDADADLVGTMVRWTFPGQAGGG